MLNQWSQWTNTLTKRFHRVRWHGPDIPHWNVLFYALWGGWFLLWSVLPLIALENDFIDILENIVWGRHFQFGYDKNPYLGAWIGYWSFHLTGGTWISYFLSQVFVSGGFVAVYLLARKMLNRTEALFSVLLLWGITFYGMKATELCDDVMEMGVWPWLVYCFYCALRAERRRTGYWLLTGLCAGTALMIKYYAPVLLLSMLAIMLTTREGRRAWTEPGPYLAGAAALLIALPNILWLLQNNFVAIDYALGRASLEDGIGSVPWSAHFTEPLRALNRALGVLAVPAGIFAIFFCCRDRKAPAPERFDRIFVGVIAWGPFALTLLFSLLTGGGINYSWVVPCFLWFGLFCFLFYRPRISAWNGRGFIGTMVGLALLFGTIFLLRSTWHQGYRKKGCDYENYPGRESAAALTELWRAGYGTPLRFVVGNREDSCNQAVYSSDMPEAYFSANPAFSQWIDEEEIRRHGGLMLCSELWPEVVPEGVQVRKLYPKPEWWSRVERDFDTTPIQLLRCRRAVPDWFRRLAGEPSPVYIAYCFIIPRESQTSGPTHDGKEGDTP